MAQSYWVEEATRIARERIQRNKATMKAAIGRPVKRRPNTADLVVEAIARPDANHPIGREELGRFVRERYGEGARHIFPHLGLDEDGKELTDGAANAGTNLPGYGSP